MAAEEVTGGARKATKSKLFEFLVHGVRPGMPSGARMPHQGAPMGPPGPPYVGSPSVRPGMPQAVMEPTRKRAAPQPQPPPQAQTQTQQQQPQQSQQQQTQAQGAAPQNRSRSAKRRKMADKILPQRIRELVPESQAYMDLLAFERKLDQTIMRKRVDIQEALKRPMKQKRKLRLYISNTFNPAKSDAEDSDGSIASWELRVEGKLLDDLSKQKRKFSSFFKSLVIELDKDLYGPDNHLVEWHRTPTTQETDGFQVKRPGDVSVRCTLLLMLDYQYEEALSRSRKATARKAGSECRRAVGAEGSRGPRWEDRRERLALLDGPAGGGPVAPKPSGLLEFKETLSCPRGPLGSALCPQPPQFKLDPRLARLLGIHTQTRSAIIQALWQYIKTNKLQDSHDKEYINCDKYFQQIFDCSRLKFSEIPQRLTNLLLPPDPIVINHIISVDPNDQKKTACYDIDVEVEDPLKGQMSSFLLSTANQQEITALDNKIHETIESINQLKIQRDFMLSFSKDPKGYIQDLLRSQSRDLKVMTDVVGNPEEERRADFYQQPWSQEAVSRYFYCKIQQRRQELEQSLGVRNT
ncbi:PREDICTED: SWI/SNF-related matrix-associated actin-dependent regulator of chromatin subfamily D member 3 isoform X1 [Thamnophis sirtalis]|uniref:SWI/SNF-related matrix-associated actin-dependent regulator of chromatin subfamily D member 3 isoform X1 n=2 Tax=Thamnophis sirtalis TaxID=35019 RepID=A0A6I9YIH8_9SAUR|nr:PREDICTED: SWI/SNF-related matrix-associated actin-dependent regulator of chromatin subfamily D member 3 isoform X1 [Thamnophis sirtalis]